MFREKEMSVIDGSVKTDRTGEMEKLLMSKMSSSTPQSPHHRHHYHQHVLDSGAGGGGGGGLTTPGSSSYNNINNNNNSNNSSNGGTGSGYDSGSSSTFDVFSKYQTMTTTTTATPVSHRVDQLVMGGGGVTAPDPDYYYRRTTGGFVSDEHDLVRDFQGMNLGVRNVGIVNNNNNNNNLRHFGFDPDSFRTVDRNVTRITPHETCKSFIGSGGRTTTDLSGSLLGGGGSHSHSTINHHHLGGGVSFDDKMRYAVGQRSGGWNIGDSLHSITTGENQSASLYSGIGGGYYDSPLTYPPLGDATAAVAVSPHLSNDWYRTPVQNTSSLYRSCTTDPLQLCRMTTNEDVLNHQRPCSQQHHLSSLYKPSSYTDESLLRMSHNWNMAAAAAAAMNSAELLHSQQQQALNRVRSSDQDSIENRGLYPPPHSVLLMKNPKKLDPYAAAAACEDTYIIQGRRLNGSIGGKYDRAKIRNNTHLQVLADKSLELFHHPDTTYDTAARTLVGCNQMVIPQQQQQPSFSALSEVQGCVYLMAKDQHGCRFLQKQFEEGTCEDVQKIFDEIVDHIVELMMNPFGNYLIQKLLEVCREEQRMRIVHMVTREPGELVRISLNTHGTRVVQKLIETLGTREEISLVVRALEPGFLDLIKDLNGNHVVQRCLQCLSSEDNKFIFDAAAKFCVDIATHRHGCCVLQRCIDHSYGEQQAKLISEICASGLLLAQDPFGNYVVQYILEKKISAVSAQLVAQFEGHYAHLSMQKFSSHVVEKCLKFYEECRPVIVHELLSVPHFEQVLQDQYANYVIQSALDVTKGALHDTLVAAVRPHTILRTNPHCKKIFSRGLLKK